MAASKRTSANTLFPFDFNTNTNPQVSSTSMNINMKVNTPRYQLVSPSTNSSRSASVLSNVFSKVYAEHIQDLSNSPA